MHILRRSSIALVVTVVFASAFVACDSGGGGSDGPPPEEVRTTLQDASNDLSTNLDADLMNGAFGSFAQDLFGSFEGGVPTAITEKISANSGHGELLIEALDQQNILETSNGRLDYEASTGEWSWAPDQSQWTEDGSSDDLILHFPSESKTGENNTTFRLAAYDDTEVTTDGGSEYPPTQIDAAIDTDEQGTVFSVDLGGTSSETATYQLGETIDVGVEILTAPLLHTFELSSPSATQFNFSFGLENEANGNLVMGFSADVALNNDDYDDLDAQDVDEVSGNVDLNSEVTIAYTLDVDDLAALGEDPSPQEINNELENASILFDGEEVATLEFGTTTVDVPGGGETEVETLLVVYNDGSEDPFSEVFGPLLGATGNVDLNSMVEALPIIIQQ